MKEYKKKVKENGTISAAIKRDDNRADLLSQAFHCAAKTIRPGIPSFCGEGLSAPCPDVSHQLVSLARWLKFSELMATARGLSPDFSIAYSTRSQLSNVRWVCCWREVIAECAFCAPACTQRCAGEWPGSTPDSR